jgi:hypothetical protein
MAEISLSSVQLQVNVEAMEVTTWSTVKKCNKNAIELTICFVVGMGRLILLVF